MNEADFAMLEEEKMLRVIALGLAVWTAQCPTLKPGEFNPVMLAGNYLKFLKGEST